MKINSTFWVSSYEQAQYTTMQKQRQSAIAIVEAI